MSITSIRVRTRYFSDATFADTTFVELNISHPMESGHRRTSTNELIPSWYLTRLELFLNNESVAKIKLGPLVSRNPALTLALANAKENDAIKITWSDNRGESGEKSSRVSWV